MNNKSKLVKIVAAALCLLLIGAMLLGTVLSAFAQVDQNGQNLVTAGQGEMVITQAPDSQQPTFWDSVAYVFSNFWGLITLVVAAVVYTLWFFKPLNSKKKGS